MSMEAGRTPSYARNRDLEQLLAELTELLAPAERLALERRPTKGHPPVLIVGAPRSGTTLLMQWLAASGALAYPTNLLSRFYHSPAVGARVQQLLTHPRFAHRDELEGIAHPVQFSSDLGKTAGPLAPNEFWYFWRRFLPTTDIEPIGDRIDQVDFEGLRASLDAMSAVFGLPLAMKGMMTQYDIGAFARELPSAVFLHVEREACANVSSLLAARERFFGDRTTWYSAQPPEYAQLKTLEPEQQVAGQVVLTNRHIRQALDALPAERSLHVPYEAFCADPASTWTALRERLAAQGEDLPSAHPGPTVFEATRTGQVQHSDEVQRAVRALTDEAPTS